MGEKMTLLPCPFCGSVAIIIGAPWAEEDAPTCDDCMATAPTVAAWNRRHLTQPAQAVDVGAEWRPFYASVIQSLAVLARAPTLDDGPRETIPRDTVMGEVVRIRAALDRISKTIRTAALPNANGKEGES